MDFAKLDPMLAAELSGDTGGEPGREVPVFVHVAGGLARGDGARLARQLGLSEPVKPGSVLTLTLPVERVGELSGEPWVVAIRAARRLRPLQ
jgi:hypothetical protein